MDCFVVPTIGFSLLYAFVISASTAETSSGSFTTNRQRIGLRSDKEASLG